MMKQKPLIVLILILSVLASGVYFPAFNVEPAIAAELPVVDDFEIPLVSGFDSNGIPIGFFTAQDVESTVSFDKTSTPPEPVPDLPEPNYTLMMNFTVASYGVVIHGFENVTVDTWVSQDWSAYEGLSFWLYGNNSGTELFVDLIDNRNSPPLPQDDAERFTVTFVDNFSGWRQFYFPFSDFTRKEINNGAPNDGLTLTEVHGWAFGTLTTSGTQTYYLDQVALYGTAPVRPLLVSFASSNTNVKEGLSGDVIVKLSKPAEKPVKVRYTTSDGTARADRDYIPVTGMLTFDPGITQQSINIQTLDDSKYEGDESVLLQLSSLSHVELGIPPLSRLNIQDNDSYDPSLLDDFETFPYLFSAANKTILNTLEIPAESALALPSQGAYEGVLQVTRSDASKTSLELERRFAAAQDWQGNQGLSFWYFGSNSGRKIKVNLLDNQALDPGPTGWQLVWKDEFNTSAGTPPDQMYWGYELGDGTVNGIPGWGNDELEYYTDSTENAATDGLGNLVITAKEADGSLLCYYGPCQYTSARLLTKNKFEIAYGRIEARIKVPSGAGLWPAFWSLGTDIDRVGWPQSGEIDIMENVGRLPNEIFGTIHGPGYSGGDSFGRSYDFGEPAANDFHTIAVEWQPDQIYWYVDGIKFHSATPDEVAPNEWVFNHPFYLLLNVAIGGNFGGPVGEDTVFPQMMLVDYVRLYQAPDTAERFDATFTDSFSGWQRITLPFSAFRRSDSQPAGAPNDGLTLASVWGYGFKFPGNIPTPVLIDQVSVQPYCSYNIQVTNTADSGDGSLRQAINDICFGGEIGFNPDLADQTTYLTSGELTVNKSLTIDGASAPGLSISGGGLVRPLVIDPTITVFIRHLRIVDGYGFQLAGGILNNGNLTLDHVIVENNTVTTDGEDWWKGGAGIYNGDGSSLYLVDSTVRDNTAQLSNGGGIYAFSNTLVILDRSTLSGNSANVGGGLRTLGDVEMVNSTISGNSSYGWHGGALFHTDGTVDILNSTIANNSGPDWGPSAIFIGSFDPAIVPTLKLTNTIIWGNQWYACDHWTGTVNLVSGGHNLIQDDTCNPVATDLIVSDAGIGPLGENGGPTWTHALLPDSPALDAADDLVCPATDQRGVLRPQGLYCDIGAFELAP
jgi:beta-glucanase (GH16 family)